MTDTHVTAGLVRTPRDRAEADRMVASLQLRNAQEHARGVGQRLGFYSPEHRVALVVVEAARAKLVACYDRLIELDRGVPAERGS